MRYLVCHSIAGLIIICKLQLGGEAKDLIEGHLRFVDTIKPYLVGRTQPLWKRQFGQVSQGLTLTEQPGNAAGIMHLLLQG